MKIQPGDRAKFIQEHTLMLFWRTIYHAFMKREAAGGHPISILEALLALRSSPWLTEPAQVADCLHMPRQTMTNVLDKLEREGWVRREPHRGDRRRTVIRLTDSGTKIADKVIDDIIDFDVTAQAMCPEVDMPTVRDWLSRYARALNTLNGDDPEKNLFIREAPDGMAGAVDYSAVLKGAADAARPFIIEDAKAGAQESPAAGPKTPGRGKRGIAGSAVSPARVSAGAGMRGGPAGGDKGKGRK